MQRFLQLILKENHHSRLQYYDKVARGNSMFKLKENYEAPYVKK